MKTRAIVGLLVLASLVAGCRADDTRAYLVKFAEAPGLKLKRYVGHYLDLARPGRVVVRDGAYYLGVVESGDHLTLIDTGVSPNDSRVKKGRLVNYVEPVKALEAAGWKAADFTEVVLTHVRWTTMGNLGRFPSATVYMQREGYSHLEWKSAKNRLRGLRDDGRLVRLSAEDQIYPGLRVRRRGRVTNANQVVIVDLPERTAVLMGPLAPFHENIWLGSGPPNGFTRHGASRAIRDLRQEFSLLVPSRDRLIESRFEQVAENVWEIE
jgi:hypothetical protein